MKTSRSPNILLICGLIAADGLFFGLTSPAKVASFWLIAGFGLIVFTMYELILTIVWGFGVYWPALNAYRRRIARSVTLCLSLLLALQSASQLSRRDIAVLVPLSVLLYLYMYYIQRGRLKV